MKKITSVTFILDKSGSMGSVEQATISGFNEYLQSLKKTRLGNGNSYNFSLVLFDTVVNTLFLDTPIQEVEELTDKIYQPDGNTALYDAVCKTIVNLKKNAQKKLVIIMTDGQENSSQEFTEKNLKELILTLEKTGKWTFVFLGANQDSWATAQRFGIQPSNTSNFRASSAGVKGVMDTLSFNTMSYARAATSNTFNFFSKEDQDKLSK